MSKLTKDDPRFDAIIDASDPDFAHKLSEALGLEPGDTVEIVTPQFDRQDGIRPVAANFDFNNLPSYPEATLKAMGCCMWDGPDENGEVLWLYPAEWYDRIPAGHMITTISGEEEVFQPGVTDDDRRFGVLAYGFTRRTTLSEQRGNT